MEYVGQPRAAVVERFARPTNNSGGRISPMLQVSERK